MTLPLLDDVFRAPGRRIGLPSPGERAGTCHTTEETPMTSEHADLSGIYVVNAMPLMADVLSGAVSRPRVRGRGESLEAWARRSPAWRHVETLGPVVSEAAPETVARALGEALAGDGGGALALAGAWIALNEDGTRVAVLRRAPSVTARRCQRCAHEWLPRATRQPVVCPACKSPYWATPRHDEDTNRRAGRSGRAPTRSSGRAAEI